MPVLGRPLTLSTLVALLTLGHASLANAEDAKPVDAGAPSASAEVAAPRPVRWHGSTLVLNQRVGTQTVGVGADYQSRNPFYDGAIYFRPRYYLWEREPSSLSLRAQLTGSHEFTNSDSTTKRGEFLLEDTTLSLVADHVFGAGDETTLVAVSVPRLTLPTSYASRHSGKIVEAGVRVFIDHGVPLRTNADVLPRGRIAARLGYAYEFVTGTVPTSDTLVRLRKDLEGHTVENSQIGGAAFSDHSGVLRGIVGADLYRELVSFALELGLDPTHKRKLPPAVNHDLQTGPAATRSVASPARYVPLTYLDTAITFHVKDLLDVAVGYENITTELGDDGRRRNILYSPDAKFYLAAELSLDRTYEAFRGPRAPKTVAQVH